MEIRAGQTQQVAVRNTEGRYQVLAGDKYTGAMPAIDISHFMVHASRLFTAPDIDTDVDIASPKEWLFVTPDNDDLEVHMDFVAHVSGGAQVELFEAPTVSDMGSQLDSYNHHRTSEYTSEVNVYADPTVTGDGTRIDVTAAGSSGGPVSFARDVGRGAEWDLKPNTMYLLRVTVRADNQTVSLAANWYEFDENDDVWAEPSSSSSA